MHLLIGVNKVLSVLSETLYIKPFYIVSMFYQKRLYFIKVAVICFIGNVYILSKLLLSVLSEIVIYI